jgi:hypothetical protein
MKKKKFDSFCVVCKKPAQSPAGFSNVNKVTLCRAKVCRRQRKTELQKARRRQLFLKLDLMGFDVAARQDKQTRQRPTSLTICGEKSLERLQAYAKKRWAELKVRHTATGGKQ